jgi:DNA-directed RNA polymerase specialized sigma24 family protein
MARKNHYLPADKFKRIYLDSVNKGEPSRDLIECFYLIAREYASKFTNFSSQDVDSAINYAVSEAWQKWETCDLEREDSNIFSWFTTMIINDMLNHLKKLDPKKGLQISIQSIFEASR